MRLGVGYFPNNLNQYGAVGSTALTYDANGNTTFDTINTYAYDTENRLISATVPGHSIAYSYDPEGRLDQETVDAGTPTSFYHDGLVPMSDYTFALFGSGGQQIHRQVFGAGGAPLYLLVSGVRSYAYEDALGSVVALANGTAPPAGALAGSYGYAAFGGTLTPPGPVFRYAGQRFATRRQASGASCSPIPSDTPEAPFTPINSDGCSRAAARRIPADPGPRISPRR